MENSNNVEKTNITKSSARNVPTSFEVRYINPDSCDLERMKRIKKIMAMIIADDIKKTVK